MPLCADPAFLSPSVAPRIAGSAQDRTKPLFELLEPRVLFASTIDIAGVGAAALDQPQINLVFRATPDGDPLGGGGSGGGSSDPFGGFGDPFGGGGGGFVKAYLDTGTS